MTTACRVKLSSASPQLFYSSVPSIVFYRHELCVTQLIATIKRQLKSKGLTYRDVARALQLSEPSVKRLFSSERFTVDRLAQISHLLEFTLADR